MVQDVATRWNYTLSMLKRAFSLRKVIPAYLDSDVELQRYVIMEHEWALVQEVIKLLEPLEEVFKALVAVYELEQVKSNIVLFL